MEIEAYWKNPTPEGKIKLIKTLQTMGPTGRAEANRLCRLVSTMTHMVELEVAERAAAGNPTASMSSKRSTAMVRSARRSTTTR